VRVEASRKAIAVVFEVRLHRVPAAAQRVLAGLLLASESFVQLDLRPVTDLADPARDAHADVWAVALARVVVVTAAPLAVGADATDLQVAQPCLLGGGLRADGDHDGTLHPRRPTYRPLEHAHPAHRAPHDRAPLCDPELVHEPRFDVDLVANRDAWKARAVG